MHRLFATASSAAVVGSVFGVITHDSVVTWTGVAVAVASAIVSVMLASYHKLREASRDEDRKDRDAQLEDIRALARVQIELENRLIQAENRANHVDSRITIAENRSAEITDTIERVRCKFPTPDGAARCGQPIEHANPKP